MNHIEQINQYNSRQNLIRKFTNGKNLEEVLRYKCQYELDVLKKKVIK